MKNSGQSAYTGKPAKGLLKSRSFKIPSKVGYIKKVSDRIERALRPFRLEESILFDVKLCVEEAVRNAMVHGNRSDEKLCVEIVYRLGDRRLEIEVQDMGDGFDYEHLPDPTEGENLLKPGGRGVFLMRHLMDEVSYNSPGNRIKMVKFLPEG